MPTIDETHPDVPLMDAALLVIQGSAHEDGPNELRALLCAAALSGAILLGERGVMSRGQSGAFLAATIDAAARGGEDGTGTLDALRQVADALRGAEPKEEADAPHG